MSSLRWSTALLLCATLVAGEIQEKGWWRNAVFYQVYPRSFMDANDDGIGDLKGITQKLQHFKDSGINAVWLSPIYASPMIDFGYDISDFKDIDESFGTMADLEELTSEAKKLGIKIIMDLVPNHTSDKHEWFQKSLKGQGKYKNYYMWRNGKDDNQNPPNNWVSVFSGPAWTFNSDRKQYYFHQFEYRQPDLNYTNKDVREEMEEIIRFWLSKGIDGFRVDAIPHVYERDDLPDEPLSNAPGVSPHDYGYLDHIYTKDDPRTYELIASWRKILDDYANQHNLAEKVILTEAYTNLENTTKFYNYGSHVPFNFNFIISVNKDSKPKDFKNVIDEWTSKTPSNGSANWVMGNHDRSRVATRYPGRADQMTMLAMILPGVAVTYNGEEIAMEDKTDITWAETQDPQACNTDPEHYQSQSRDPNRTPFQWDDTENAGFSKASSTWLPVNANYKELNLKKQKAESESHYSLYKSLTSLKRDSKALQSGKLKTEVTNSDEVLVVVRESDRENVILLVNFADDKSQSVDISSYLRGASNDTVRVSSVGSGIKWGSEVKSPYALPGKASVVLISLSSSALSVTPMKILLVIASFVLYKLG